MLAYLHNFNQLKMILNAKLNYSKTEKYGNLLSKQLFSL